MKNNEKEGLKAVVLRSIKQVATGISDKQIRRVLMSLYIDLSGKRRVNGKVKQ